MISLKQEQVIFDSRAKVITELMIIEKIGLRIIMSEKEDKKEKNLQELSKAWCKCPACGTRYLCEDGCPKCKR
jgi:radical SAM protein with 4Fe4S-binding SPASM domain